jgi:hypothetical protein
MLATQQNLEQNFSRIGYYNEVTVSVVLVKILEVMFVAGWAGSAIVLLLTGFEDVETLLDREDENSH